MGGGRGYLPWMGEGYLLWMVPILDGGMYLSFDKGNLPWTRGTYLGWGDLPKVGTPNLLVGR